MWHILFFIFSVSSANDLTKNVIEQLISRRFQGSWESLISQPFQYLESEQGESTITFHYEQKQQNITHPYQITEIQIIFLDPKYYDERVVAGVFNVSNENEKLFTSSWIGETNLTYLKFYKERERETNIVCLIDYSVDIKISENVEDLQFTIDLGTSEDEKNPACQNIDIVSGYSQDTTNFQGQILFYSILLNTICAIQYFSVSRLTESLLNDDDNNSQRISIFCVGFVTIYDTYIAFQNLSFAFRTPYFQYFIVPAIFFFMLTMNCDLKLLWIVCRTRFYDHFQDPFRQRQFLARFFILYYISVLGVFLLLQQYELYNSFLLMIGFFITPQIIHNFKEGTNPRFIPEYIFGFLLVNIAVPLYFRGNPSNFRKLKPSWEFCVSWILIYMVQIAILYFQYLYGPRKIIPKCLLPKQYNYYQTYKPQEAEECVICLLNLMIEPEQQDQDLDRMLVSKILMVTPCGHKFHPFCLKNWMEIKLSCPTCRNGIPPDYQ